MYFGSDGCGVLAILLAFVVFSIISVGHPMLNSVLFFVGWLARIIVTQTRYCYCHSIVIGDL